MVEKALVKEQRRVSSIWIIPGLALLLGGWMLFNAIVNADPVIEVRFETANGIEAGRTKVKTRNIEIGVVESVRLSDDYSEIIASLRINRESADLLREDTQIWVLRPRIGIGGISGVSTLLSGAYIVLEPGTGKLGQRSFTGLETPPATPATAEGLRLTLFSEESGSINLGDPVLYRGRQVGQVDGAEFELNNNRFRYDLFVRSPYDSLVTTATRFWKASAIQLQADANGFSFNADSLQSVLAGGIAFDLPADRELGSAVEDGVSFRLFSSKNEIDRYPYHYYEEYLVFFDDSVRGLKAGAPVEYRGIPVGHVIDVSFSYLGGRDLLETGELPVPALIRIYPGYFEIGDSQEGLARMRDEVARHSQRGLRAALQRGSLLTGNLYIGIDFFEQPDESLWTSDTSFEYPIFPTQSVGLEQIERRIVDILNTVDGLPLDALAEEVREAIVHAREMFTNSAGLIGNLDTLFANDNTQSLPDSLRRTLAVVESAMQGLTPESDMYRELEDSFKNLNATLTDIQRLAQKLERQPSSLLFSKPAKPDPEPKAAR